MSERHQLESLRKRVADLEKYVYPTRAKEREDRGMSSFTPEGGLVVIGNVLATASDALQQLTLLLNGHSQRETAASRSFQTNANAYSIALQFQGLLDSFASLCDKIAEDGLEREVGNVYWNTYSFVHPDVVWANEFRTRLRALEFSGKTFNDYVNFLKHEQPWIGIVSESRNSVFDIYDANNKGFVYDVLVPAYRVIKHLLEKMAGQLQTRLPHFRRL